MGFRGSEVQILSSRPEFPQENGAVSKMLTAPFLFFRGSGVAAVLDHHRWPSRLDSLLALFFIRRQHIPWIFGYFKCLLEKQAIQSSYF